jgi:hypothetical protein
MTTYSKGAPSYNAVLTIDINSSCPSSGGAPLPGVTFALYTSS